uniref:Cathepsin L n=1 Tax=Neogobius melanostomus TaxID=47308 RepID=A0A8C6SJT6_9GOBI
MLGVWLLVCLCAPVLAEFDSRLDQHWELWKKTYQKKYHNEVCQSFAKNVNHINTHNLEASLGLHTYTLGINHLSDLTKEEVLKFYANLRFPKDFKITPTPLQVRDEDVPDSVDWRESGLVTSVKDQGECGSCWAFSAVGALEGMWAKTKKKLVDLSPQNLVDCSGKYGNEGCGGGYMHQAFDYVIDNQGIDSEASYPYKGEVKDFVFFDGTCRYNVSNRAANCSSYQGNDTRLWVSHVCRFAWGAYGMVMCRSFHCVYYNPDCPQDLDHGVLLVGYGTDDTSGLDYWLIKNSWGEGWGENGYIRMARNKGQMCGISLYSVYPE